MEEDRTQSVMTRVDALVACMSICSTIQDLRRSRQLSTLTDNGQTGSGSDMVVLELQRLDELVRSRCSARRVAMYV
jgi:hypothetical protein